MVICYSFYSGWKWNKVNEPWRKQDTLSRGVKRCRECFVTSRRSRDAQISRHLFTPRDRVSCFRHSSFTAFHFQTRKMSNTQLFWIFISVWTTWQKYYFICRLTGPCFFYEFHLYKVLFHNNLTNPVWSSGKRVGSKAKGPGFDSRQGKIFSKKISLFLKFLRFCTEFLFPNFFKKYNADYILQWLIYFFWFTK